MSGQPSFPLPTSADLDETTGRHVIVFRDDDDAVNEGLSVLKKQGAVSRIASAADYGESAMDMEQFQDADGAVFPNLQVAVVSLEDEALNSVTAASGNDSAILSIEPERIFYALGSLDSNYLRGYKDAVNNLYEKSEGAPAEEAEQEQVEAAAAFFDDAQSTWGLKATRAVDSRYTGRGVKVAVLDTGMDLKHPDFRGRSITSRSFIPGQAVQDGNGHGTHCIGTSCGSKDANGRRYGVASDAAIFAGKVLSNGGSGATSGILAGMEWAVANKCQVISMSLGNRVPTPSTAYETVGRRALSKGSIIIAASGNHAPGTTGQPANSPSIMAVGAVDFRLSPASFSSPSGSAPGANVDVAGPGVNVYSSVPMPRRYASFNGTSMATPHVAGIAALYSQAYSAKGYLLWLLLNWFARRLPQPSTKVGSGLAQAPR